MTIDAMGCQTEIAQAILDAEGRLRAGGEEQPADVARRASAWFFLLSAATFNFAGVPVSRHETQEKGHGREETRTLLRVRCSRRSSRPPALAEALRPSAWPISDTRARRQAVLRDALLHPEQEALGEALRRGGSRPLVDRESLALATRCDLPGGSVPPASRPRRRQLQHPPPHGPEPAEEQPHAEGRREEQTPRRRLG